MARTASTMPDLGTRLPDFALPDTDGDLVRLEDVRGDQGLLVMFLCRHCPFVQHVQHALAPLAESCRTVGVGVVAINSNDVERYPDDGPGPMRRQREELGWGFPYLLDASQEVAKAFRAACTPDFFLFDGRGRLVYRGQLDASRPGNGIPVTGHDLRAAVEALSAGRPPLADQRPSLGCNIKWRPGAEPPWFSGA